MHSYQECSSNDIIVLPF